MITITFLRCGALLICNDRSPTVRRLCSASSSNVRIVSPNAGLKRSTADLSAALSPVRDRLASRHRDDGHRVGGSHPFDETHGDRSHAPRQLRGCPQVVEHEHDEPAFRGALDSRRGSGECFDRHRLPVFPDLEVRDRQVANGLSFAIEHHDRNHHEVGRGDEWPRLLRSCGGPGRKRQQQGGRARFGTRRILHPLPGRPSHVRLRHRCSTIVNAMSNAPGTL